MDTPMRAGAVDPIELIRSRALRAAYEATMVTLALAVVLFLIWEPPWAHTANLILWALFGVDYALRLAGSADRRLFVRRNVVDLIAILPLDFFRAARSLRILRLIRLLRAGTVLWRVSASVRGVLRTNGLAWVLVVTTSLVVAGTVAIRAVEPDMGSFTDALWWSVVTATTVGYGDVSPATGIGRLIAAALMLVGIGTIGMITGSIATYFVVPRSAQELDPHVATISKELERWHEMQPHERRRLAMLLAALADAD